MTIRRIQQAVAALLAVLLVLTGAPIVDAAPAADEVRTDTITGTITGGQFLEIWLDLEVSTPNADVTVLATWDSSDLGGVGVFILSPENVSNVQSGGRARENNIATGNPLESFRGSANQQEARFNASSALYKLVIYNESAADRTFTITSTNATIVGNNDLVSDPNAPSADEEGDAEGDEAGAEGEEDEAEDTAESAADATPEPVEEAAPDAAADDATGDGATEDGATEDGATEDGATEDGATEDGATEDGATEDDATETEDDTDADEEGAAMASGEVRAEELAGSLPNRDDQHFLGLEPSERDGTIELTIAFEPQDNDELARRLNFWVLDNRGFERFGNGESLSTVAIAAGSSNIDTADNERVANFRSVGFGPYTVIVYNSSNIPATYTLTASGAMIVDDAGQTDTAKEAIEASDETDADENGADDDSTADDSTATDTAAAPAATTATTASTSTTAATEGGRVYRTERGLDLRDRSRRLWRYSTL